MTVFFAILLTILTFAFIAYPLFKPEAPASAGSADDENLLELQSRRNTTYFMLKELEFDFQSGILTEDDYQDLEKRYKKKAVSILKDIDGVKKGTSIEEEIEKRVLKLRQGKGRFCSECGERYQEGARF